MPIFATPQTKGCAALIKPNGPIGPISTSQNYRGILVQWANQNYYEIERVYISLS